MLAIELFLILLFGLIFGSFISALSYRIPNKLSFVKGRSFCPKCKSKISWFDNIPLLSFFLLKGKCRNCQNKISFRYPLIEIFSVIWFTLIYVTSSANLLNFCFYILIYLILALIFIIDLEEQIIPDELTFIGYLLSFIYLLFLRNNMFFEQIFFGFFLALLMLLIHLITKGKGMGLGDVKFTLFPATLLPFPQNLFWLLLSFIIGSIFGIFLILTKRAKFGKHIPFGPFLAFSFMIFLLWGESIVKLLWI